MLQIGCHSRIAIAEPAVSEGFGLWFVGFMDGEGCFMIRSQKGRHSTAFQLNLREDDLRTLVYIQEHTRMGRIYREAASWRAGGYISKPKAKWFVQSRPECRRLVDIFDMFPPRSKKLQDYRIWREAVYECCSLRPDQAKLAALKAQLEQGRRYKPTLMPNQASSSVE